MAKNVTVNIKLSKPASGAGFGYPLLVESGATKAVDYTVCYSLEDVVAAGFANDTNMYNVANAVFAQENAPAKIAVYASTGTLDEAITAVVSKDFRQIVVVNGNSDEYIDAADFVETTSKMLFVSMSHSAFNTFKTSLAGKDYKRTVIFVNATNYANAALVGGTAGRAAGSFTYMFKTLKNVTPEVYTTAELNELHEAGAIAYITNAGDNVTSEGISQNGTYIDETDGIDYVVQNIQHRIQKVLNGSAKVPYDDRGIAMLEAAATSALQEAAVNGIIAQTENGSYDYSVSFAARSATTEGDRASRVYKHGSFRFVLAGAIHNVEVDGVITF